MPDSRKNEAFARTSFLQGANAAYIEEMQALVRANPGSVTDEWRHFFASLQEDRGTAQDANGAASHGPSWARAARTSRSNSDLMGALTGDYGQVESGHPRPPPGARAAGRLRACRPSPSLRATQDSIRALMLIRAYRVMGHLAADLDPLGLAERKVHKELQPETYGFTDADLDRPIFIDKVLGLEIATVRQILKILRRTYCRQIGVEFMHITSPAQKSWIQERIEGEDKDIRFTVEGKKAILNKLIEAETFEKFCRRQVHRHQALRPRRRRGDGAGARADHQARRPARRQGDRHRHGAPRPPQRARQRDVEAASRHLQRVQGRLVQAGRRRGLGRRQVPSRRLVRPRVRRQQRASVADRQPLASRDRRSGRARQGARQAGPARLRAPASARRCCRC